MPIVYKTKTLLDRFCYPDPAIITEFEQVAGLMDAFNVQLVVSTFNEFVNDLVSAYELILGSVIIAFFFGFIYMAFVYLFSGIIVWLVILIYFILLALFAYFCNEKAKSIKGGMDARQQAGYPREQGQETENTYNLFLYLSYGLALVWVISFIVFCCALNTIRRAVAIIKTACLAVKDMPQMLLIPIVFTIFIFIHFIWWLVSFGYVLSTGNIGKDPQGPWAKVTYDDPNQEYYNWFYVFGGLWNNAFLGALNEFILASCVAIWYFSGGGTSKKNLHKPISRSVYRAWRYHLGSLAFGSLLLAIIQLIRILLLYYQKQLEALGGNKNKFTRCMLKYAHCCMACLEKVIAFITRTAYIMIAIEGKHFLRAAKDGFRLIMNNPGLVAILNGIGAVFRFIGKFFIAIVTTILCYYIMDNYDPWKTKVANVLFPLIVIFIIAFIVGILFMSVYGMAIDTILLCFLKSEEINRINPNQAIAVPAKLQTFLDNEKLREEKKAEKMLAKVK